VFDDDEIQSLPRERVDESDVEPVMWLFGVFYEIGRGAYLSTDIYMTPWPFDESVTSLRPTARSVPRACRRSSRRSKRSATTGATLKPPTVRFIVRDRVYAALAIDLRSSRRSTAR